MAANSPNPTPTKSERVIDDPIKSSVAGKRSRIACTTGSEFDVEYPKSPRSTLPSQPKYCTYSGRSRPKLCLRRAMSAAVMCGFCRYGVSGPPGAFERMKKRIAEMSSSSGIA